MRFRTCDAVRLRGNLVRGIAPDDDQNSIGGFTGRTSSGERTWGVPESVTQHVDVSRFIGGARDAVTRRAREKRGLYTPPRVGKTEGNVGGIGVKDSDSGCSSTTTHNLHTSTSSNSLNPEPTCRFCFEGETRGTRGGTLITPCACSGTQAFIHVKCLRRWQDTAQTLDGGKTCQVCRRMFLAPPRSLVDKLFEAFVRGAKKRAIPFALLTARLVVDLAREDSAASVILGRGPVTYLAALIAFIMDCERLHRFSQMDVWEDVHAHLATVALQGVLTKAVERSAREFRENNFDFNSHNHHLSGWVHFAHDVLNFPHLMTLCYGVLCVDAERAPIAVVGVRGMRVNRSMTSKGWLEGVVEQVLHELKRFESSVGVSDALGQDKGFVQTVSTQLLNAARWVERASDGKSLRVGMGKVLKFLGKGIGPPDGELTFATWWDAPCLGDFWMPN